MNGTAMAAPAANVPLLASTYTVGTGQSRRADVDHGDELGDIYAGAKTRLWPAWRTPAT